MVQPFAAESSAGGGFLGRLRGRRAQAAIDELREKLAGASRIRDISPDVVDEIAARHGADVTRELTPLRQELYRGFLEHCLRDCALSAEERAELAHLRGLLCLNEGNASEVHDGVARAVYGEALERVLEDHRLDAEEETFLRRLQEDLRLPDELAADLRERAERRSRHRFVQGAAVHDHMYVTAREAVIELEGASDESLEAAIRDALEDACRTVPNLEEAEVSDLRVGLRDGEVAEWRVRLRARISRDG